MFHVVSVFLSFINILHGNVATRFIHYFHRNLLLSLSVNEFWK